MNKTYLVVLGMALVTYLPRVIPLVFLRNLKVPPFIDRFLKYIPYSILGALIFPGIIHSSGTLLPSIIGSITALILAWLEVNLIITVIGSILVTALVQMIY